MKTLLFATFFLSFFSSATAAKLKRALPYFVKYETDSSLKKGEAKVTFQCALYEGKNNQTLRYGINGSSESCIMSAEGNYSLVTKPKKGVFQFYYNAHYQEITTDSIQVTTGMNTIITLNFERAVVHATPAKPVIYLYPEVKTDISVTVNPVGSFTFTYPEYKDAWKVTAEPNGDLSVNGNSYRYLFWESEQQLPDPFSDDRGFIVNKENTIAFLEEKLTVLGLSTAEQTDFITYWGPRLTAHDQCKVKFFINEACNAFADLTISPAPAHINRVYIVWIPAESTEQLNEQQLPVLNRDGFDVLEWGGVEIPTPSFFHASTH